MGAETGEGGEFKREIGWFSSFAMGYGDVGADIFIALGIVTLYAGGAAPFAFLLAALIYVSIGLAYAELAPTYPYAGGVQVYTMRALNTLMGFLAGWAIMLSYTLDISLFSVASAGYLKYLFPGIERLTITLPVINFSISSLGLVAAILVIFLIAINYVGIRYSAGMVSALVGLGLLVQALILVFGFGTSFDLGMFLKQIVKFGNDQMLKEVGYLNFFDINLNNFLYGVTLAMASFVGIESIAQAAEETKRPHKWIPRAAKLCVVAVPLSVLLFSVLSIGVLEWRFLGSSYENPIAVLASKFPYVGKTLALLVSFAAFILCLASANTGVIGVSRLTASMGKFSLLPSQLYHIHPKFKTPTRTILIFGLIGFFLTLPGDIPLLASLYNFGASFSYFFLMLSLLVLRKRDSHVHRPWKIPLSLKVKIKDEEIELSLIGLLGLLGTAAIWILIILLNPAGRMLGFAWILLGLILYAAFRKGIHKKLISGDERNLVVPAGYRMRLAVLVRPSEDPDVVRKSITRALDKRFSVKLISIVDIPQKIFDAFTEEELDSLKRKIGEELDVLAQELRKEGFEADYIVRLGDFSEELEGELEKGNIDFVAYIVRGFGKAAFEKGMDEKVRFFMSKHRGKIMLLKRVTE